MCFDRNINGNKDFKSLEYDFIFACVTMRETHVRTDAFDYIYSIILKKMS